MIEVLVGVGASLLGTLFAYIFTYRHRNRHTIALHRHPDNLRRKRVDIPEITTTGDIYRMVKDNLKG